MTPPNALMPQLQKRTIDAHDAEIGRRVRIQRLAEGLSQRELGQHIGVSFQQIQKYEKGVDRISSGRLRRIAEVLGRPIEFFFANDNRATHEGGESVVDLLKTAGAVRLIRAYSQISNGNLRHAVVQIVEEMATKKLAQRKK
jgi:transcriptional regulator with XRE-family HTH domain